MLKIISTFILSCVLFTSTANGAFIFSPSLTYMDQTVETSPAPTKSKAKLTIIDMRLGYVFDFGLYLGGLYSLHDQDILSDSSDSYFGPSVGFFKWGFSAVATFHFYGEKDLTSGVGKYSGVNGYQLDFGYSVPINETVSFGPQLTYHSIEFDELETNGISAPASYKFSGITPYFNVTFVF